MRRQRNTAQIKEQGRNLQDQTHKEEISNLPETELRIMTVKMLQRLENRMEKRQETINTVNCFFNLLHSIFKSLEHLY